MNIVCRYALVFVIFIALQGQSMACSGVAIGAIGSSSANSSGISPGVPGQPDGLLGASNLQIDDILAPPIWSEQTEFEKELSKEVGSAVSEEFATHFAPENIAPIVNLTLPLIKFNGALYNSQMNSTPENIKAMEIAGVETGLATTGAAIAIAVGITFGIIPAAVASIGLAVASHFGAIAISGLGTKK